MRGPRGIGMHQRLVLVVECTKEAAARVKQGAANQLEPLAAQATPVNALLSLEGDLEVAAPVRHREALGGLHAALQYLFAMHLKCHLLMIVAGMELAHLVIEEILLVLKSLGAANVL